MLRAAAPGLSLPEMSPLSLAACGRSLANGRWPKSRPAGCFPGSRSPSAPASSFISPPIASRRLWAALPLALAASIVIAVLARRQRRRLSAGARLRRGRRGLCRGHAQDRLRRASGSAMSWRSSVALAGFVEVREERERSDRIVVRAACTLTAVRLDATHRNACAWRCAKTPRRRSARSVSLKARLSPPLAPLRPGGYDFARDMYFCRSAPPATRSARSSRNAAGRLGRGAALCRGHRRHSRDDRQAHPRRHSRRRGRDRFGADHRQARRHLARRSTMRCMSQALPMCCRSPAITWRWSPASSSFSFAPCWR